MPRRVEVQLDLVDQHHALSSQRVWAGRVGQGEAPREIRNHGQKALLAVGELIHLDVAILLGHHHAQRRPLHAKFLEPWYQHGDGLPHGLELAIAVFRFRAQADLVL